MRRQERDDLYEKFESTIYDVQQKSGFKNIILERKLQVVDESLEKKEAQLSEVLAAANLDPNMLGTVSKKLDDVLDAKNSAIKDLQYELARVTKAHKNAVSWLVRQGTLKYSRNFLRVGTAPRKSCVI